MTHPHLLHALAAATSLKAAASRLSDLARAEARQRGQWLTEAASVLRSPIWGSRASASVSDHGDPTGGLALLTRAPEPSATWTDRAHRLQSRLTWIADQTGNRDTGCDPIDRIRIRLPLLAPAAAAILAKHLQDEDRWVREDLGMGTDEQLLLGTECPVCHARPLRLLGSGAIVCPTRCRCTGPWTPCLAPVTGPACPCRMPIRVAGVAHIWTASALAPAIPTAA